MKRNMVICVVLMLSFYSLSCSHRSKSNVAVKNDSSYQKIEWSVILKDKICAISESGEFLIKSQEDFDSLWGKMFPEGYPTAEKPKVDFTKFWIIAAFKGEMMHGGYDIDIQSVEDKKDSLVVIVKHTSPGPNCLTSQALEYPYLLGSVGHFATDNILFRVVEEIKDCQ